MQKGFTLIETMILIAIIGICAAIFIPAWQKYQNQQAVEKVHDKGRNSPMVTPTEVPATPPKPPSEVKP